MANVKISALPTATAATGVDVVPLVQSGVTKKLSMTALLTSPTLFGSGMSTFLATPSSDNLRAVLTDETGTGAAVFATSPTLTTPTASGATLTGSTVASANAGAVPPSVFAAGSVLAIHGSNGVGARSMIAAYGAATAVDFRRANGTAAAPTTLQLNDTIGVVTGSGYNGTAYTTASRASISLNAAENWTAGANGTFMSFTITPTGGTATTEVGRVEANGRLEMGNAVGLNGPALSTTAPADLYVRSGNTYVDNTTAASGTVSHGTVSSFGLKGIAATNATVTYTNASTIYVHGAPNAGSNVTITNPWATYIAAGKSYLGDQVDGNPANADSVGFRGLPQNAQSAAYTTVAADAGKSIVHPITDNNARTFTIDSNANVPYPVGTAITFINMINTVTIAITTDTMYLAGSGATGSRTLAAYGMATAVKVTSTSWIISGSNLS
jgi:hypothetical protein